MESYISPAREGCPHGTHPSQMAHSPMPTTGPGLKGSLSLNPCWQSDYFMMAFSMEVMQCHFEQELLSCRPGVTNSLHIDNAKSDRKRCLVTAHLAYRVNCWFRNKMPYISSKPGFINCWSWVSFQETALTRQSSTSTSKGYGNILLFPQPDK